MIDFESDKIALCENIQLVEKYRSESYRDYNIIDDGVLVGTFDIAINDESIFIRYIKINKECRRKHYASKVVDSFLLKIDKDLKLCISGHNKTAPLFWEKYFKTKNVEKIIGTNYMIKNEK